MGRGSLFDGFAGGFVDGEAALGKVFEVALGAFHFDGVVDGEGVDVLGEHSALGEFWVGVSAVDFDDKGYGSEGFVA